MYDVLAFVLGTLGQWVVCGEDGNYKTLADIAGLPRWANRLSRSRGRADGTAKQRRADGLEARIADLSSEIDFLSVTAESQAGVLPCSRSIRRNWLN
jgi:hypothetical protein